jgi:hypothetical protein
MNERDYSETNSNIMAIRGIQKGNKRETRRRVPLRL